MPIYIVGEGRTLLEWADEQWAKCWVTAFSIADHQGTAAFWKAPNHVLKKCDRGRRHKKKSNFGDESHTFPADHTKRPKNFSSFLRAPLFPTNSQMCHDDRRRKRQTVRRLLMCLCARTPNVCLSKCLSFAPNVLTASALFIGGAMMFMMKKWFTWWRWWW